MPPRFATAALLLLPLALLAGVIGAFVASDFGRAGSPIPINKLDIERTVISRDGFHLHVRNVGPQPLTIAQVIVNDAIWYARVDPGPVLGRLDRATVNIPYGWVEAEPYEIKILTGDAIVISTSIEAAVETPTPTANTLLSLSLIGLFVGVIPVFLGILWYPALRRVGRRGFAFLMALTAGLLVYLGVDAGHEALELAGTVAGPFQGVGLVAIGVIVTALLLESISRRRAGAEPEGAEKRRTVAGTIALGIGLHNLGEGLAIGAAYAIGEIALGTFLVVGFMIQNVTEGLGIVAPILRDRPTLTRLAMLGAIGGGPAIAGVWIGSLAYSRPLAVLFLAIGAGAVFQVAWEIARLMRREQGEQAAGRSGLVSLSGVTAGMLLLYVTGVLIK